LRGKRESFLKRYPEAAATVDGAFLASESASGGVTT
jgi:hypothetical protein